MQVLSKLSDRELLEKVYVLLQARPVIEGEDIISQSAFMERTGFNEKKVRNMIFSHPEIKRKIPKCGVMVSYTAYIKMINRIN